MKKITKCFLIAAIAILICSCNDFSAYLASHPKNYQNEIEDYVRFTVSETNFIVDNFIDIVLSSSSFEAFNDEIHKIAHNDNSKKSYEKALSRVANNANNQYNDIAKQLLNEYQKTMVILSDYRKVPTSSQTMVWEFTEINTGILFQFSIDEQSYGIKVDDDSIERYLEKNLGL